MTDDLSNLSRDTNRLADKVALLEKITARHAICVTTLFGFIRSNGLVHDTELAASLAEAEAAVRAVSPRLPGLSG